MSKSSPLVSIGMPVRNNERTLSLTLRSLLAQTYTNWELVLINDGSTDGTMQVARQFTDSRIHVYSDGAWRGAAARLNQAIAISQGEFFARMDGDDIAYPRRLEYQVQYLCHRPEIDLVGAQAIVFAAGGVPLGKRPVPEESSAICARPFAGFPMLHPTFLGHLTWFRRFGYQEEVIGAVHEDQDLLLRSYRSSRFANVPEILLGYREEKLDLGRILSIRRLLIKSMTREFRQQRRWDLVARAFVEQILKAGLDSIAISTGLKYHLLRHRARPITNQERQEWLGVWRSVDQVERELG